MSEYAAHPPVGEEPEIDLTRRKYLTVATSAVGAVGVGFMLTPFLASWKPSERARAAGAPAVVDVSKMEAGQMITANWRKQPIYIVRRTPEMLAMLPKHDAELKDPTSTDSVQPEYAGNVNRSRRDDLLVLVGICTHLGCLPKQHFAAADPQLGADWPGGFFCVCHGSKFDMSGRVFKGSPASVNLVVPPYSFEDDNTLVIGTDDAGAAKGVA
ncbi:MAG: ubiquinol-cytochrome c reductase iron-sulfur subunit [Proteobacteria bacterium]|nr:ubiquinol-cytochrome c reductase iron-sulfur subunit [Pseudomonadota bacterium]